MGWWEEYFGDILNLDDTPSVAEEKTGLSGSDLSVTQAEVTDVISKNSMVARPQGL